MNPGWTKFRISRIALCRAIAVATFIQAMTIPVYAQLATSMWPMYRYDLAHTGQSTVDTTANTGAFKWWFTSHGAFDSSPAVGPDGTIYVGSTDGHLYAINPDGSKKWAFQTGGPVFDSSPAIGADGTIYVGDVESLSGHLYAVNPDGSQKWAFQTAGEVSSSPAIGRDGTIYVGEEEFDALGNRLPSFLYAVNPDGSEKWAFQAASTVFSSPAIAADGTIYVGSDDFNLYAVNPDGTQKWTFLTGSFVESSPAVGADGTVYVGSYDNNLYAIKPDGTQKWVFATMGLAASSPGIASDGTIYLAAYDGSLYAIDPDGAQKWAFTPAFGGIFAFFSSPAIGADGAIYVGSGDANLYAINADGTEKWIFPTDTNGTSSPAIGADGTVYVGSDLDFNLQAVGAGVRPVTTVKLPAFLDFGHSLFCSKVLTIENTGTSSLFIFSQKFKASNFSGPVFESTKCGFAGDVIAAGTRCKISVSIDALLIGPYTVGTLTFIDNAGTGAQSVVLKGGVVETPLTVSPSTKLSFGGVQRGSSVTKTITLHAHQPGPDCGGTFPVGESIKNEPLAADFTIVEGGTCGRTGTSTLGLGASCTLKIKYSPSVAGPENATLSVADFAQSILIDLRGTGQ